MNARSIIPVGRKLRILRRAPESIHPSSPRPTRRDCHGRLVTALLDMAGDPAELVDSLLKPWCSATFVGARHELRLRLWGEDAADRADRVAAALPDADFRLPGHIVADLAVDEMAAAGPDATCIRLSILTIEDW